MPCEPILTEFVPLLRQVLAGDSDPDVRQLAELGEIESLAEHEVTNDELSGLDRVASALSTGNRPPAAERFQKLRDTLRPHLGKKLLRAAIRCAGRGHQIEIDRTRGRLSICFAAKSRTTRRRISIPRTPRRG